jgi:diguanylate cyclase (GGDEF)-like protein
MSDLLAVLTPLKPAPEVQSMLARLRRLCIGAVALIAVANVCLEAVPWLIRIAPASGQWMSADAVLAVLLSAIGLQLSEANRSGRANLVGMGMATLVALLGVAILLKYGFHLGEGAGPAAGAGWRSLFLGWISPQLAAGFALLGATQALIRTQERFATEAADLLLFCLMLLVLIVVSGYVFGASPLFGAPTAAPSSPQTMICLLLLTITTFLLRAEFGVFSILLGRGIGSRMARIFSPFVLVVPFLREASRARLVNSGMVPANYAAAILVSLAATVTFAVVLVICWRVNGMEMQIRSLSLLDELTGLYNLRGFQFVADHALRQAQRSQTPFSVLFIDLDNLKKINDTLGHVIGSLMLNETGNMLRATFRDTDVLGRIGGDEFAVAGQFSQSAITVATQRLKEAASARNAEPSKRFDIGFSIGCVTSDGSGRQTLAELLGKADAAMYQDKRSKKLAMV